MICSLHVLLRGKHREGLLMSAALIAICRQKTEIGMRLDRVGELKDILRAEMKGISNVTILRQSTDSVFSNIN